MTPSGDNPEIQVSAARSIKTKGQPLRWWLFIASILLFVFSLLMVKEGARPLARFVRSGISVDDPFGALGLGWLAATLILSGSPVAATALAFLDAGVLNGVETFAMIAGSRLGASFIVLFVGFIYTLRGRKGEGSLGAGLLSLLVTQTVYFPALLLGFFLLQQNWFGSIGLSTSTAAASPFELLFNPILSLLHQYLPTGLLFPFGFGLMLTSFWLFDKSLPEIGLQETSLGRINRLLYRPLVSFALGAGLTALTMSVSVSLGLLVPLSERGFIRQENAIPYIMGANITTFIDTLIAAALLSNPAAITVVLVQIISVSVVSLLIIVLGYRSYEKLLSRVSHLIAGSRRALGIYLAATLVVPLMLLILF